MDHLRWTVLALLVSVSPLAAQDRGDPVAGRELARRWCTECHDVGIEGVPGGRQGPAFRDVASMPSTTGLALSVFLQSSHPNMPNIALTPGQSNDLVAYILSLAK
jgi:cytochrome c